MRDKYVGGNSKDSTSFKTRAAELKAEEEAAKKQEEREKKSPFSNFAQLNLDKMEYLISLSSKSRSAWSLLLFMFRYMNEMNVMSCPQTVFMECLGMSRTTVSKGLGVLMKHGFIHVERNGGFGTYYVNQELVWKTYGNRVQYCEFPTETRLTMPGEGGVRKKPKLKRKKNPVYTLKEEKEKGER